MSYTQQKTNLHVTLCLHLLVPPQIEGDSSTFTFAGQEEKVRINGSLALSCVAKGFPEPKVRWFKDGQVGAFFI